jgi:hypothetical protein
MTRDKTIYPIRIGELINMLEEIYSEFSLDVPAVDRKKRALFVIEQAEQIGIDAMLFHEKSDLVSDAGIEGLL